MENSKTQQIIDRYEKNGTYTVLVEDSVIGYDRKTKKEITFNAGTILNNVRLYKYKSRHIVKCDNREYFIDNQKPKLQRIYQDVKTILDFNKLVELRLTECETEELIEFFIQHIDKESINYANRDYLAELEESLNDVMQYYGYIRE